MQKTRKKNKKVSVLLPVLAVCFVLALAGMVAALCRPGEQAPFSPPPFEPAAVQGKPEVPEGLGYSSPYKEGMSYRFSVCGNVTMEGTGAVVYLTNPAGNAVWLKVRVLDAEGNLLGESGLLRPGEYVRTVTLERSPAPGTRIKLKVMGYMPETYRSAGTLVLNTAIGTAE